MFLFTCCQINSKRGYEIREKTQTKFVSELSSIDSRSLADPKTKITEMKKSEYIDILKSLENNNFRDEIFGHNISSLFEKPILEKIEWKRMGDLINNPSLFQENIEPEEIVKCYDRPYAFISAVAALFEHDSFQKDLISNQKYISQGIYRIKICIHSEVEEIIVDDYFPVDSKDRFLFCRPFKNQFGLLLVEKALAKALGNYTDILKYSPADIFKALTFAPVEIIFLQKKSKKKIDEEEIWEKIKACSKTKGACCCVAEKELNDFRGLDINCTHSIVEVAEFRFPHHVKVVKLRNPWGTSKWKEDPANIFHLGSTSAAVRHFFRPSSDSIFHMTFQEFLKHFSELHLSYFEPNGNYVIYNLHCSKKNAEVFEFEITNEARYTFEIRYDLELKDLSRITLLLIQIHGSGHCEFIDGIMHHEHNVILTKILPQGKYVLYVKLDGNENDIENAIIGSYSEYFITLKQVKQEKYPNLLQKAFFSYALKNDKIIKDEGKMWISYKSLIEKGGFAFMAFKNLETNDKKLIIRFDESAFEKIGFKLKKKFKNKGDGQILEIKPGEEQIILCRAKATFRDGIFLFPPEVKIEVENL